MADRPRILVSNDDGFQSEGLKALAAAMEELGEVWVVAPEAEQSASSRAISIHRPLRLREVRPRWYAVDGTPTDCAWLGIHHVLKGRPPRILVSGINHGPNLADDVTYSGTLAAAMEASMIGVPAIAFSLAGSCSTTSAAFAATFSALKPYFSITTLSGAEAPKRSWMATIVPNGPAYLSQPSGMPASTATRARTVGGSTESRYSCGWASNSSHEGMLTTRAPMPFSCMIFCAPRATSTSEPVAIRIT